MAASDGEWEITKEEKKTQRKRARQNIRASALAAPARPAPDQAESSAANSQQPGRWADKDVWAYVAIDRENYVRGTDHVKEAMEGIKALPYYEDLKKDVKQACTSQRLNINLGSSGTEWETGLAFLLKAFGERLLEIPPPDRRPDWPITALGYWKLPEVKATIGTLREQTKADIEGLEAYKHEMAELEGSGFGRRGLPVEKVHVICVGDERPLQGKALQERLEGKLLEFVTDGLISQQELNAYLKEKREAEERQRSAAPQYTKEFPEGSEAAQYWSDIMDEEEFFSSDEDPEFMFELWKEHFLWLVPTERFHQDVIARMDAIDGDKLLRAALEDIVRRETKRIADTSTRVDPLSKAGVKGDAIIHELGRQLVPKSLVVVSNDKDFFQMWDQPSFIMQLGVNGQRRKDSELVKYGLEKSDLGMAFAYRCALIGKQEKIKGPLFGYAGSAERDPMPTQLLYGNDRPKDQRIGSNPVWQVDPTVGREWTAKQRASHKFVRQACAKDQKRWRQDLGSILEWLRGFWGEIPAVRCQFLANILEHNIRCYPLGTESSAGKKHVLNLYETEYRAAYEEFEGSLITDMAMILCKDHLAHLWRNDEHNVY